MIRVTNLRKSFGDVEAVRGVSFDVASGEIFAFLGPNGAGKTTTIQMLTTLLVPTAARSASTGSTRARTRTRCAAASASSSRTPVSTVI